jgi:hypothetical protein
MHGVESVAVADVMARIDEHTTLEDVTGWHVREYLVSGGQPMWSGSMTVQRPSGSTNKRLETSGGCDGAHESVTGPARCASVKKSC